MSHPHAEVRKAKHLGNPTGTESYRVREAWYFVVKGKQGEPVATGELYTRPHDAGRGVEDLREIMAHPDFTVEYVD